MSCFGVRDSKVTWDTDCLSRAQLGLCQGRANDHHAFFQIDSFKDSASPQVPDQTGGRRSRKASTPSSGSCERGQSSRVTRTKVLHEGDIASIELGKSLLFVGAQWQLMDVQLHFNSPAWNQLRTTGSSV